MQEVQIGGEKDKEERRRIELMEEGQREGKEREESRGIEMREQPNRTRRRTERREEQ